MITSGRNRRLANDALSGARSRMQRLRDVRDRRKTVRGALLVVLAVTLAVAGIAACGLLRRAPVAAQPHPLSAEASLPSTSITSSDGSASVTATGASALGTAGVEVEVPSVVGKTLKVAEAVISGAGFAAQTRVADPPSQGVAPDTVTEQWPQAGALVEAGSPVVITYQPRSGREATDTTPIVVIDAGHQKTPDLTLEPIGPGSKTTKPKVSGGATGVSTLVPENHRTLELALKLRDVLVANGVAVVMIRTTDAVNISNSERAKRGNAAKADLVIRIHMDSSADAMRSGISTLYPSGNAWVAPIEKASKAAAQQIQAATIRATGAASVGVFGRSDMSGFNYSTRPTVLVLAGFLSNKAEDERLGDADYQKKLVGGLADGVLAFLNGR